MLEFHERHPVRGGSAGTVVSFFLLLDALLLVAAGGHLLIGAPSDTIDALFSLDNEPTIPGWYASVKLLLLGCLVAALAISRGGQLKTRRGLLTAALLFLVMSCDESAAMHERIQRVIGNRFLAPLTDSSTVFAKVVLGLTALAAAVAAIILVLRALKRVGAGRVAFAGGFLLLASGAVGVDLFYEFFPVSGAEAAFAKIFEEALEAAGVTLMIYGTLQALASAPVIVYLGGRLYSRADIDSLPD